MSNVIIWGNHSNTQFPDASHGAVVSNQSEIPKKVSIMEAMKKNTAEGDSWMRAEFLATVQNRGAAVISARKLSSAMSAANAIADHMRDWWKGTGEGKWVSMAVYSGPEGGKGPYNVPGGIFYSYPVTIDKDGEWRVVSGLDVDSFSESMMRKTADELLEEKKEAMSFLKGNL